VPKGERLATRPGTMSVAEALEEFREAVRILRRLERATSATVSPTSATMILEGTHKDLKRALALLGEVD